MQSNKINILFKKGKHALELLEHYDKTRELLVGRKRIDITLSVATINKLKELSRKIGKPVSRIIEERIEKRAESRPLKTHLKPKETIALEQTPTAEPVPSYIG